MPALDIESILEAIGPETSAGDGLSSLWRKLSDARGKASAETMPQFLSPGSDVAVGVGMPKALTDEEYRAQLLDWIERYRDTVTPDDIRLLPETDVGSPKLLELNGLRTSLLYIKNFSLANVVRDVVARHGATKPRSIVEIGAGYGGMLDIILRRDGAERATVIDIPGTLPLSAWYLSRTNPERTASIRSHDAASLRFFVPEDIDGIADRFDLALNFASFGEMPKGTALGYIDWITKRLSPGGLFISHNSAKRTPEGVTRVSEYGLNRIGLVAAIPQPSPAGVFHDQHLVLVGGRHGTPIDDDTIDFIFSLVGIGLHVEVREIFSDPASQDWQRLARSLSTGDVVDDGSAAAAAASYLDAVRQFLKDGSTTPFGRYAAIGRSPVALALATRLCGAAAPVPAYLRRQAEAASPAHIRNNYLKRLDLGGLLAA